MKNILKRTGKHPDGIFGEFFFENEGRFCVTLEHAYQQADGSYEAKIPPGEYLCLRGMHWIHKGAPFETFEISGVPMHHGLLFHAGNFNRDSAGCVLIGRSVATIDEGEEIITGSRDRFSDFMARLDGVNRFDLDVS